MNPSAPRALKFEEQLTRDSRLQQLLSWLRARYAYQDTDGEWHFGPSKFIGFKTDDYFQMRHSHSGTSTEVVLRKLSRAATGDLKQSLEQRLSAYLAPYGKTPNSAARIRIVQKDVADETDDDIVDLDPGRCTQAV